METPEETSRRGLEKSVGGGRIELINQASMVLRL